MKAPDEAWGVVGQRVDRFELRDEIGDLRIVNGGDQPRKIDLGQMVWHRPIVAMEIASRLEGAKRLVRRLGRAGFSWGGRRCCRMTSGGRLSRTATVRDWLGDEASFVQDDDVDAAIAGAAFFGFIAIDGRSVGIAADRQAVLRDFAAVDQ